MDLMHREHRVDPSRWVMGMGELVRSLQHLYWLQKTTLFADMMYLSPVCAFRSALLGSLDPRGLIRVSGSKVP